MNLFSRKKMPGLAPRQQQPAAPPPPAHIMDGYGSPEWAERNRFLLSVIDAKATNKMRVTMSCLKGGVTKTSVVLGAGSALAMMRRDMLTIIDANPHRGTAAERLGEEHGRTVRDMLNDIASIQSAIDYQRYASQAATRLEIIASDKNPEVQELFSAEDYRNALDVITYFRPMVITDTGIDLLLPMMKEVYSSTDVLVVPATTAADGFRLAEETLDWWEIHAPNGKELVRNAVVPLTVIQPFALSGADVQAISSVDELRSRYEAWNAKQQQLVAKLTADLQQRVRAVVPVPYDTSLATGYKFDWNRLSGAAQDAYIEVAYQIALAMPQNKQWQGMTRAEAEQRFLQQTAGQSQVVTPWDQPNQLDQMQVQQASRAARAVLSGGASSQPQPQPQPQPGQQHQPGQSWGNIESLTAEQASALNTPANYHHAQQPVQPQPQSAMEQFLETRPEQQPQQPQQPQLGQPVQQFAAESPAPPVQQFSQLSDHPQQVQQFSDAPTPEDQAPPPPPAR